MPQVRSKSEEKKWQRAKAIVSETSDKKESSFSDRDWALTNHIFQNMKTKKRKSSKSVPLSVTKKATSVVIAPFEPIIEKAIALIEKSQPGYFSSVKKIVVEQSVEAGDPFHFGKVKSDEMDTIYVSMNAVRSAMSSSQSEDQMVRAVASVLAHEMGHLKANMGGGEGPAEAEESRIMNLLSNSSESSNEVLLALAIELNAAGFKKEAAVVNTYALSYISKTALPGNFVSTDEVANTIIRIVYHFTQKVKTEKQKPYIDNIRRRLIALDQIELSTKKKNPGAGVGASISIIKNLLSGHNQLEINRILGRVAEGLTKL